MSFRVVSTASLSFHLVSFAFGSLPELSKWKDLCNTALFPFYSVSFFLKYVANTVLLATGAGG